MKHFFLFGFLAFFAVSLTAQETTVRDSSWIENRNGIFFQARQTTTSAGVETTTVTPIGDTVTTTRTFVANIQNETARLANDANVVRQYRAIVTELARFAREIPATINRTPLDSIAATEPNLYTVGFWDLNGTPIRFRRTAAGLYQYRADSTTTWRPMTFLGNVIRLNNFNGYTTDLYKVNGRVYRTINSQYTLRPVTVTAPRSTQVAEAEAPPTPDSTAQLMPNGTVKIGADTYRWNTRSKKWVKI